MKQLTLLWYEVCTSISDHNALRVAVGIDWLFFGETEKELSDLNRNKNKAIRYYKIWGISIWM